MGLRLHRQNILNILIAYIIKTTLNNNNNNVSAIYKTTSIKFHIIAENLNR